MNTTQKIVAEIKMSSEPMATLALSVLDVEVCGKNLLQVIRLRSSVVSEMEVEKFLNKHKKHIERVCNNRRYYLGEESDDCMQFINMCLCKAYHKRHRYTNWKKVVRSIIKRRAIDFTKFRNNSVKNIVTETDLFGDREDGDRDTLDDTPLYSDTDKNLQRVEVDIFSAFNKMRSSIEAMDDFTARDRDIVDALMVVAREGVLDFKEVSAEIVRRGVATGYELSAFFLRVRRLMDKNKYL